MTVTSLRADAPAKINLALQVLGLRDDGFHDLHSLAIGIDWCDRLVAETAPAGVVELECSDRSIPQSENLVYRAAKCLMDHLGSDGGRVGVRLLLEKRLPAGGGLGGGSSDAATTLKLCNRLWSGGLSVCELANLGAELGSDVPLFFHLPAVQLEGRGERVAPVTLSWSGWVLLVCLETQVSTPEVYQVWRQGHVANRQLPTDEVMLSAPSAEELMPLLYNDLEPAVFRVSPSVSSAMDTINMAQLGPFRVSGAGSTLFRLFDEEPSAQVIAHKIDALNICAKTRIVKAPVQAE